MARIDRLVVRNIRSHKEIGINLPKGTTVVTGINGSGKTSLMEAIYIASRGSSFKGADREVLNDESKWYRIDMKYGDTSTVVKFDSSKDSKRKQFEINGQINYRLLAKHKLPIVLFEPDDLRLIHGSPSRRRKFIDNFISQIDKSYGRTLSRYEKAMKQRNFLLQADNVDSSEIFAWDIMLSDYGSEIITLREDNIKLLNEKIDEIYNKITNIPASIRISYSINKGDYTKQKYLNLLNANRARDILMKSTSIGPHRHDVLFSFNDKTANKMVSRGEARTIILSLKLSEVEVVAKVLNDNPIILLDDVFSELDSDRQLSLARLTSDCQVIISSAHTPDNLKAHVINLDS